MLDLKILDRAILTSTVVCLERLEVDSEVMCIPIARSDDLVLVHAFNDFNPDGLKVLSLDAIDNAFREPCDVFFERVVVAEGAYKRLKRVPDLDLSNWRMVLRGLRRRYEYCSIECELEVDYFIGKIIDIKENKFSFWSFNAAGEWEEELLWMHYDVVNCITFDDEYTHTITKYIPKP